jgi:hypothetical protein
VEDELERNVRGVATGLKQTVQRIGSNTMACTSKEWERFYYGWECCLVVVSKVGGWSEVCLSMRRPQPQPKPNPPRMIVGKGVKN